MIKDKAGTRRRQILCPLSLILYPFPVAIKLCPKCKRPFLAAKKDCPHCPEPYTWNQESWANVGCLMATLLPLVLLILFWLFLFLGPVFR